MKSVIISAAAVCWAALASSAGVEQPKTSPIAGAPTVQGCFSSPGKLVLMSNETYNSIGKCGTKICLDLYNKTVAASSQGVRCYCGDKYPAQDTLVDDSECNVTCPGWGPDNCGGAHTYTVYNTGKDLYNVEFEPPSSASSKPSGSSASDSSTSSVTVTQTSDPNAGNSSGPNTAGIAAGVVVAVVVVGAIVGCGFFYLRRRRNREIEEEHRRNAAVNSFIGIGKPPSSSGGLSISDSRLDPVMAQRRMSDGSIADNHDYSRKILRVTNA